MNKTIIASLIGLAFSNTAFSAENIQLNDVVVTATRVPQPREAVIADVTVIDSEQIQRGGQSTLVELLQLQPGVEITSNGGAGKASGIFMRGTNTSHVVVVVDGVRIQSATAGTATFENLPIQLIDRIEILRGPASSLYGPDAIGGVIQIFTKKGVDGFKPFASLGYGTYDTKIATAGVRGKAGDTSYALNISASDIGGFSALDANNNALNDNDGYRNLATSANVSHKIADGHELGIQFFNSDGTTRFDNRFNATPDFSSKARLEQQSIALFSNNQFTSFWLSKLRVAESRDNSKTFDEFSLAQGDIFNTRQTQVNWQNDFSLPVGTLTFMYDRLHDKVDSNTDYDKIKRSNEGYVASYLANIGAHSLHTSLREDHNSQFGNYVTGGLGYGFAISEHWRVTASYGNAFKTPTFNDLYYPGFNNPNLRPEKSDNVEASVKYQNNGLSLSATAFENRIRDLIGFDLTTFTIENISKARIQGLSLAASQQWEHFDIAANVDFQSPRNLTNDNLLVRRANRNGKLNVGYTWQDWRFGAEVISASSRYNDAANDFNMGGYTIFNLLSQYKINPDWSIQARANNVFDKHYNLALDGNPATTGFAYNTPGANLFVNIRYEPQ
ncbi:outer membrane cobalamin receptor protein [Methylophilaceae bacterium 11]|nr:outer membrane cobalamin receptor protein [Methylophilaceae bacterium 11]